MIGQVSQHVQLLRLHLARQRDGDNLQDPRGRAGSSREPEYPEARRSSLFVTRQRYPEA
jgi:hypothetical protein